MSKVDIRTYGAGDITTIEITDRTGQLEYNKVLALHKASNNGKPAVLVECENQRVRFVIQSREDIQNTIKALELAMKLGWYH